MYAIAINAPASMTAQYFGLARKGGPKAIEEHFGDAVFPVMQEFLALSQEAGAIGRFMPIPIVVREDDSAPGPLSVIPIGVAIGAPLVTLFVLQAQGEAEPVEPQGEEEIEPVDPVDSDDAENDGQGESSAAGGEETPAPDGQDATPSERDADGQP